MKNAKLLIFLLAVAFGLGMANVAVAAQVDYFLKIDGIDGESTDKDHKDWINLSSFSHGGTRWMQGRSSQPESPPKRAGSAAQGELTITKTVDKSSPKLFLHCAEGKHLSKAEFKLRSTGATGNGYFEYKLTNARISSYSVTKPHDDSPAVEHITFVYQKIEWNLPSSKARIDAVKPNTTAPPSNVRPVTPRR